MENKNESEEFKTYGIMKVVGLLVLVVCVLIGLILCYLGYVSLQDYKIGWNTVLLGIVFILGGVVVNYSFIGLAILVKNSAK